MLWARKIARMETPFAGLCVCCLRRSIRILLHRSDDTKARIGDYRLFTYCYTGYRRICAICICTLVVGQARQIWGEKNVKLSFDVGPVVSKAIELAEDKGRAEEQIEQLKDELAKAVERIRKLEAEGNRPDAEKALKELRESGDMMRLQELLIQDRDEHRDALIQRNREIAAVAYLRGDIDIATEAVNEILKVLPDNIFALNQRGHIHNLRGKLKEAENDYKRVLEIGQETNN